MLNIDQYKLLVYLFCLWVNPDDTIGQKPAKSNDIRDLCGLFFNNTVMSTCEDFEIIYVE